MCTHPTNPHRISWWACRRRAWRADTNKSRTPNLARRCNRTRLCADSFARPIASSRWDNGRLFWRLLFLFPYPFWKKVGKHSDHENAGSISRSKRPTDSGPLTTYPPAKICHDSPVLGHIPKIETFGRRNPCGARGGWTLKWPFSPKLVYFWHMSSSKFRPLRGACDLWKSCSKCEAESIKHLIQRCLRANTAENMSYHIS